MGLLHWWRTSQVQAGSLPDQRREIAQVMCRWCARRWLHGRSLRHKGCAEDLSMAVDIYLRRRSG